MSHSNTSTTEELRFTDVVFLVVLAATYGRLKGLEKYVIGCTGKRREGMD